MQCQEDGNCACNPGFTGPKCSSSTSGPSTKLLVITGSGPDSTKSEIIDLADPNAKCKPWADYPLAVNSSVGQMIGDKVVICGGYGSKGPVDKCYKVGPESVEAMPNLSTPKYYSSGGVLNESLVVTGGFEGKKQLDKTEYISGREQQNGVNIPMKSRNHCVIQVNEDELLHTGGYNG